MGTLVPCRPHRRENQVDAGCRVMHQPTVGPPELRLIAAKLATAPVLRPASSKNSTGSAAWPFLCNNLPGWRWATITKVALDRLSRSLHSGVCDSDGLRDAAIHSTISGSGGRRDRATSNITKAIPDQFLIHPARGAAQAS